MQVQRKATEKGMLKIVEIWAVNIGPVPGRAET